MTNHNTAGETHDNRAGVQARQNPGRASSLVKALWTLLSSTRRLPGRIKNYFFSRGRWFWGPVGFVSACSTTASSIVFMGAVITGRQEGQLGLTIFLYVSGTVVMLGPAVLMAAIIDSVRAWVDPNYDGPPPKR